MRSNKVWNEISNNGPCTQDELSRQPTQEIRRDGVRRFYPRSSHNGSTDATGMKTFAVYYIEGKHKPKSIIRKWLQKNNKMTEKLSNWALHQRISSCGEKWKEASRELLGPFETGRKHGEKGGSYEPGGTCALCGEEYTRSYRDHLPCDQ
jgi:hypothetical protein